MIVTRPVERGFCSEDWHDGRLVDAADLHPDTDPAAIARDQREAIRGCGLRLACRPDVAAISELVVLPVSVVARRLAEMGFDAGPAPPPRQTGRGRPRKDMQTGGGEIRRPVRENVATVAACLGTSSKTSRQIAAETGLSYSTVWRVLVGDARFQPAGYARSAKSDGRTGVSTLWACRKAV